MVFMWFFKMFLVLIIVCVHTKADGRNDEILSTLGIIPGVSPGPIIEQNPVMAQKQGYKTPRQQRLNNYRQTVHPGHQGENPKGLNHKNLGDVSKSSCAYTSKTPVLLNTDMPFFPKKHEFDNFSPSEIAVKEGSGPE